MEECLIKNSDGSRAIVPLCRFMINNDQQIAVIGTDPTKELQLDVDAPGHESTLLGLLDDQGFIFRAQIINTLALNDWDFELYPNPEIVLTTKL